MVPIGKRAPGRQHNLKRTRHPLPVCWPQPFGSGSIELGEPGMQGLRTLGGKLLAHLLAHAAGDWRNESQSVRQRLEIEPGSANENRQLAVTLRARERVGGISQI